MLKINFSEAFKALDGYVKAYNSDESQRKDGAKPLRQSMVATAQELIRLYGAYLLKAKLPDTIDKDGLPPLITNNKQLATLCNASSRTIQRHIIRLQEAGIITDKKWHGSDHPYDLWITPEVLWITNEEDKKTTVSSSSTNEPDKIKNTVNQLVKKFDMSKCPHSDPSTTTTTKKNILIGVDKPEEGLENSTPTLEEERCGHAPTVSENGPGYRGISGCISGTRDDFSSDNSKGPNGPISPSSPQVCPGSTDRKRHHAQFERFVKDPNPTVAQAEMENKTNKVSEAGQGKETERKRRCVEPGNTGNRELGPPAASPERTSSLNFYTDMLWVLAKNTLYKDVFLTDMQAKKGKQLIKGWYEIIGTDRLARAHEIYIERIGLVQKYIKKEPGKRYVQLPNRYFDITNPHGFAGTKKWWVEQENRKVETRAKLITHNQIRRYLNNEKKDASVKKPSMQLYRECEQRVGMLGDGKLLQQFYAAVYNN